MLFLLLPNVENTYLVSPNDGKMITMKSRNVNVLIIFDRFSAVFVQNPMIRSETDTRLGISTAAIHKSTVGIVSRIIPLTP